MRDGERKKGCTNNRKEERVKADSRKKKEKQERGKTKGVRIERRKWEREKNNEE